MATALLSKRGSHNYQARQMISIHYNVERHYFHLARKEVSPEKTELPKNWTCISKMEKKTCFVSVGNFLLNKQRAATEVIVEELDSGGHIFTIRANGTERNLSSVLKFDLDNSL